jgi:hypothetical protein
MIGRRLGAYQVTAKLGEGGMGEVWRATDTGLDREVAIKVLPAAFVADPERLARFQREAKLLAQLHHPNIASIFGLEESAGTRALVMAPPASATTTAASTCRPTGNGSWWRSAPRLPTTRSSPSTPRRRGEVHDAGIEGNSVDCQLGGHLAPAMSVDR